MQTKGEYTPGPWEARCFMVMGGVGMRDRITHTGGHLPPNRSHESEANARLIAAAPELLAANLAQEEADDARTACPECEGEGDWTHCGPCSINFGRAIELRRAAIAKAKGLPS